MLLGGSRGYPDGIFSKQYFMFARQMQIRKEKRGVIKTFNVTVNLSFRMQIFNCM